ELSPLARALLEADSGRLEKLLREAAEQAGVRDIQHGFQEGRFAHAVAQALGLSGLSLELARLKELLAGLSPADARRLEAYLDRRLQDLADMIKSLVRGELQRQDVTRGDQQRLQALAEKSFYYLSEEEIRRMQEAVTKLAQRLRNVVSIRRKRARLQGLPPGLPARGEQAHHGHHPGRRAQQLQPAARLGAQGRAAARQAGHLAQPREQDDLGLRRQRDGPLRGLLHPGRGVPEPEPALPRDRPPGGGLIDGRGGLLHNAGPMGDAMSRENFILMTVGGLTLDPVTKTPIVILRDPDNKLNLPIWIGLLEATAMATELEGIKMARPMTHDLLRSVIGEVGASVEWVEVTDLKDNTYFALIYLRVDGRQITIDARPSDAISLALRTKSPIYVAKKVLEASSVLQQMEEGKDQDFANVVERYPGAPFGRLAVLYRAHALARQGDQAAAATAYGEYLASAAVPVYLHQEALVGLARAKEAAGDTAGALDAYTQAGAL